MRTEPTPAEARLWYHLRAHRFEDHKFRHQTVLGRYIVDFTSRSAMLAIEIDGGTHARQQRYDDARTRHLESEGFHVVRFTNAEVMGNIEGVLQIIRQALTVKRPQISLSPSGERAGERGVSIKPPA